MRRMRETGHRPRLARRPRTSAPRCGSTGSRRSWQSCRAHGIDPVTELIPVAPGRALRQRRRPDRPATAAPACPGLYACGEVRLHRRARREPAGVQLAAGGPGLRRADRRRPGRPACRPPARPASPTRRHRRGCCDAATRDARRSGDDRRRRRAAQPRVAGPRPLGRLRELGLQAGRPASPATAAWEATNLHTVATFVALAAPRRGRRRAAATGARTSPSATTLAWRAPAGRRPGAGRRRRRRRRTRPRCRDWTCSRCPRRSSCRAGRHGGGPMSLSADLAAGWRLPASTRSASRRSSAPRSPRTSPAAWT